MRTTRHVSLILVAALLAATCGGPATGQNCVPICDGLVGWWPGEGNADELVAGHHGSLANGVRFAPGKVGQAFSLDGSSYLELPFASSLKFFGTDAMTVELWARRTGSAGTMHLIGKRPGCGGDIQFQLAFDSAGLTFGSPNGLALARGVTLPLNTWWHLVGTTDGSTVRLYTNGILAASTPGILGPSFNVPIRIGASGDCSARFQGLLDEVTLFNRALTGEEILALYTAGSAGKCGDLQPPVIVTEPSDLALIVGERAELSVVASGIPPFSYQWSFNGTNLVEATRPSLRFSAVQLTDEGRYEVVVRNCAGSVVSRPAYLDVVAFNTPPFVSDIPDQTTRGANPVGPIGFTIGDLETPASNLTVTVGSSMPMLIADFTLGSSGTNRTLQLTPAAGQTGTALITVTVTDAHGLSTSETFLLNVQPAFEPPWVTITAPTDRATFRADFDSRATVIVEAIATDDQQVSKVEFISGTKPIGSDTSPPYHLVWERVAVGDYILSAVAMDNQGLSRTSAPVSIAVTGMAGDVAIMQTSPHPEIATLRDHLFEMGLSSVVFDETAVSPELLRPFRLVIRNDGSVGSLTSETVRLYQSLRTNGIPLYFIGERNVSAPMHLSAEDTQLWATLIHALPTGTSFTGDQVVIPETARAHAVITGRFGVVGEFHAPLFGDSVAATAGAEVLATGSGTALVIAHPADQSQTRTLTQNFGIGSGADGDSMRERKKLFQNGVCWLAGCEPCSTYTLRLEMTPLSEPIEAFSPLTYLLRAQHSGECEGTGVLVTNVLPPAAEFVAMEFSKGSAFYTNGTVVFRLGRLASAEDAELRITVIPKIPGVLSNVATIWANNELFDESNSAKATTTVIGPLRPVLSIENGDADGTRLRLIGRDGIPYRIEHSVDLVSWTAFTNVVGGIWTGAVFKLTGPNGSGQYFRASTP